ncbi:hypothetical protein SLS61_006330 [Didymella pomorum]
MTPDRITSLEKVREALNKADSQHGPLFISLTKTGKNRPFDGKPADRLPFGPNQKEFPSLGKRQSPFASKALPSLEDLQQLLIADLRTSQQRHNEESNAGTQSGANESQTDTDQLKQLEILTDDQTDTGGIVLSFPSTSLDDMRGDNKVVYDNVVSEPMTEATVLPYDTLLSLQHSNEGTTFTTLLSGSVAWIIWPPTKHNLDILQSSYSASAEGFDCTKINVSSELRDGVAVVQTAGDAIRLPPFYRVDGERKKKEFVAALLDGISNVLQGKYEADNLRNFEYPYAQEGPLLTLLQSWDEVKHTVAGVLEPAETERMMTMWTDFLSKSKGRKCWICGKVVGKKLKDMPRHLETKHWGAQDDAGGILQSEKTSMDPRRRQIPSKLQAENRLTFF